MFERYTEKARRVIFFARYEASEFGSCRIETEHLLLGILREDKYLSRLLLPNASAELLRKEVEARTTKGPKISTSVDMPLSPEAQRVLAYAAEEAERFHEKHIGSEHMLLGLLREKRSLAADLLNSHNVTFEAACACVAGLGDKARDESADLVEIHGRMVHRSSLLTQIRMLSRYAWRQQQWRPLDILMEKQTNRVFFNLEFKDDPQFELRPGGWSQGHCEICGWELNGTGGPEHSTGYTNGRDWVCEECYTNFLSAISRTSPSEPD